MRRELNCVKTTCRIITVFIGVLIAGAGFLGGCSKSPPACDSKKVKEAVIEKHIAELKSQLSMIANAGGQPGMELSEDEWRMMRAGMNFELKNVKQFSFDEASGTLECEADLVTFSSGTQTSEPIEYTAEVTKGSDQVIVTIYALE